MRALSVLRSREKERANMCQMINLHIQSKQRDVLYKEVRIHVKNKSYQGNVVKRKKSYTKFGITFFREIFLSCLLYTSPSPRDRQKSRMPSSA